jgi:hypothetical protein
MTFGDKFHASRMPLAGSFIAFKDPASGRCPLQFNFENSTVPSLPNFDGHQQTTEQSGG